MKYQRISLLKRTQKGFTLIELLMVVVILGILAYVAMSAFSGSPNAANATAIRSGATEVAKGIGYIHANVGNGINAVSNPLVNGSATMLDVLMVGESAVNNNYKARYKKLEMRPMESEFRVLTRGGATKGKYNLLSYEVDVKASSACPTGKVCVTFDNVPDAVRDEIFTRYGLQAVTDTSITPNVPATSGVTVVSSAQSLPVAFEAGTESGTNRIHFALIP